MDGTGAHIRNFFEFGHSHVTRKIVDFRRNFGIFFLENGPRYSCQNFVPDDPWESTYNAFKNLELSPKIFEKLGENVFGGGPPRRLGPKFKGSPQTR